MRFWRISTIGVIGMKKQRSSFIELNNDSKSTYLLGMKHKNNAILSKFFGSWSFITILFRKMGQISYRSIFFRQKIYYFWKTIDFWDACSGILSKF